MRLPYASAFCKGQFDSTRRGDLLRRRPVVSHHSTFFRAGSLKSEQGNPQPAHVPESLLPATAFIFHSAGVYCRIPSHEQNRGKNQDQKNQDRNNEDRNNEDRNNEDRNNEDRPPLVSTSLSAGFSAFLAIGSGKQTPTGSHH